MEENSNPQERGQSIIIIAIAVIVLLIFAVIAVDLAYGYVHRRGDQNAADASSLAGARVLANIFNANDGEIPPALPVNLVLEAMNDYAEKNGIEDTDGVAGNPINTNVNGYFLAQDGSRVSQITIDELGDIPTSARGVEAIANSVAPSFFGGIMGLDGLPIKADAAVVFQDNACYMNCLAPIATLTMTFEYDQCYNIWDGSRQTSVTLGGGSCSLDSSRACAKDNECDFGKCENNVCAEGDNIPCEKDQDCDGICEGNDTVCSNDLDTVCSNDNQCDFGTCVNNYCTGGTGVFCSSNGDCEGTCGAIFGGFCSGSGGECQYDADCPEGEFCEEAGGTTGSSSGLGWLNWSLQGQGHSCKDVGVPSDCSETCLEYNFQPETCLSGQVGVGDWVGSAAGVKNSGDIRTLLECYADLEPGRSDPICTTPGEPVTVVVYDVWQGTGCNQDQHPDKLKYHVVGFAKFDILGYMLAHGSGSAGGHDGSGCIDWGTGGNRITGEFMGWVDGVAGDCNANGTILAPRVIK
jgi:hypothetical protein